MFWKINKKIKKAKEIFDLSLKLEKFEDVIKLVERYALPKDEIIYFCEKI
jgi:hypothetical protein